VSVLISLTSLSAAAARQSAEEILAGEPPEIVTRLEADRMLVLEDIGGSGAESFVVAYVIFERPFEDVLRLLRQAERQMEYRPELAGVKTLETFDDGRVDEQRLRILFADLVYRVRYREDPATGRLEWKLDPRFENDLDRFEGFWELATYAAEPNRTLARFGSRVDIGPAVPDFIQRGMSRKTVLRYLRNTRRWIDSNGEWRP
jgi:hypothetical protein